jgi:hypothetical protein
MQYGETVNQRDVYKLVERITTGNFKNELEFLKHLVSEIVSNDQFEIIGGRVWEANIPNGTYVLRYQDGNVQTIPENYEVKISEQPILNELVEKRTTLNREVDPLLIEKGIVIYSVTGVGEIIKTGKGKFFKYVLGFNANEILQSFYETLSVISSFATITIQGLNSRQQQEKYQKDITKASEIQRNLLPEHYLEFQDYKIYGVCIPIVMSGEIISIISKIMTTRKNESES